MEQYEIKKIENLFEYNISHLVKESKKNGFRFLERLVKEFEQETNTFNKLGEALYGVFYKGELIAIGGLNMDPYIENQQIGRLRRFYVSTNYRRMGIGRLLLRRIMDEASETFSILALHTDTVQADQFYTAMGFEKDNRFHGSTHYLKLNTRKEERSW